MDVLRACHDRTAKIFCHSQPRMDKSAKRVGDLVAADRIAKEGNLQSGQQRVYLVLKDGVLTQLRAHKEFKQSFCLDVATCSVKTYDEAKTRFDVFSPHLPQPWAFEVDTETERDEWVKAINAAIATRLTSGSVPVRPIRTSSSPNFALAATTPPTPPSALRLGTSPSDQSPVSSPASTPPASPRGFTAVPHTAQHLDESLIAFLRKIPGNSACADCGAPAPEWASINLGILICLECSGVHRALGTHISKVRSLTLDKWTPEQVLLMKHCGNAHMNELYLSKKRKRLPPPASNCERNVRVQWIKNKYEFKKFVERDLPCTKDEINKNLYKACATPQNFPPILSLLTIGADPNWFCQEEQCKTTLHQVVLQGHLPCLELFLNNSGNPTVTDEAGCSLAHYAAFFNCPRTLMRVLQAAPQLERQGSKSGVTPLELAVKNQSVDVVKYLQSGLTCTNCELRMDEVVASANDDTLDFFHAPASQCFPVMITSPAMRPPKYMAPRPSQGIEIASPTQRRAATLASSYCAGVSLPITNSNRSPTSLSPTAATVAVAAVIPLEQPFAVSYEGEPRIKIGFRDMSGRGLSGAHMVSSPPMPRAASPAANVGGSSSAKSGASGGGAGSSSSDGELSDDDDIIAGLLKH
eukprot:TRINITY_DN7961_c0_g1_i1.p1 TRINITY_DN7961_c0_g1~~TRINITY_DN7961_c0_g1_i1.p1  ORF type:complete len:639 (-),score=147.13 TRINITY_DN7961_c0_g1_i1:101-2017(-)